MWPTIPKKSREPSRECQRNEVRESFCRKKTHVREAWRKESQQMNLLAWTDPFVRKEDEFERLGGSQHGEQLQSHADPHALCARLLEALMIGLVENHASKITSELVLSSCWWTERDSVKWMSMSRKIKLSQTMEWCDISWRILFIRGTINKGV